MDHQQAAVLGSAADDTYMGIIRVKYQITGLCVRPRNIGTIGVLHGGSAAVAAITDIGLAVAVVRRLAEMDPEKYDEDLAKLELKAKRAAERKSEAVQHEKNLRRGIKRPKKQEVPDEKGAGPAGVSGKPSGEKQRRSAGVSDKRAEKAGPRRTAENGGAAKSFAKDDRTGRPFRKSGSRPSKSNRPKPKGRPNPYAHSRPVKKGKGSFRKKES